MEVLKKKLFRFPPGPISTLIKQLTHLLFWDLNALPIFFSLPSTEQMDICFWDYPRTSSIDYPQILCTVCRKLFHIWDSLVGKRFRDSEISSDPHCWQEVWEWRHRVGISPWIELGPFDGAASIYWKKIENNKFRGRKN